MLIQYLPSDIILPFVEWFAKEGEPIGFVATISTLAHLLLPCQPQHLFVFVDHRPRWRRSGCLSVYIRLRAILLTVYFALYLVMRFIFWSSSLSGCWLIVAAFLAVLLFMCMYHALSFYHRPMMYGHRRIAVQRHVPSSSWALLLTKMLETFTSYSDSIWADGIIHDFVVVNLHHRLYYISWDSVFTSYWKRQRMSANVN